MPQGGKTNKRKNYFIKKQFQVRFILKFCILLLAGVILSTGLLFLFSQDTLTSSFQQSKLEIRNTAVAILPSVIYTNLITLGLVTLATVIVTLFVSHKIAGPLFRFEQELKEIGEGNLTKRVVLRKKDQITDMADRLNDMVASLQEKIRDIQGDVEGIRRSASQQKAQGSLIEDLDKLQQKVESHFKI